ncbi:MAG: extracellular solute-binding protein [Treponema sp.]|jgi:raffinose/stachyose/melibiose transport system substrate-binding protein|nr:extracellular solute-binding protein [Treponema sp.]
MKHSRNGFWGFFLLLGIVTLYTGCSKKSTEQRTAGERKTPVTLTAVYAIGNQLTADLMHERVENYMKLNPHVTIVEKLSNEGSYLDAIRTLDAVGELPDLIEMRDTPLFVRAGKLGELPSDIVDVFENTVSFNGKVYTAPIDESYPNGIIYSKKIFNQLGINPSDIKTYNDFLGVCEKIKAAGIAPIVVGGADIWHIGFWWGYFWQREVAVKDPDWIAHRYEDKVHFTDPEIKAAMTGLNELFQKGYIEAGWASTGEGQCPSILISGQAAMYFIGPFAFQQIVEADPAFEFGFFAIPDNNGKINVTGGPIPAGWAISSEAQKDPAKAEEIYNFIRYFFSKDVYTAYLAKANALSSLKEKYTYPASEQFQEVMHIAATANDKQLMWNQKTGVNELPPNFRNFCYKLVSEWFLNVSTIDAGLQTMDQEWKNATKDFNPVTNPQ